MDYLEARGHVLGIPDSTDTRTRLICLTEKGMGVVQVAQSIAFGIEDEWRKLLDAEQHNCLPSLE